MSDPAARAMSMNEDQQAIELADAIEALLPRYPAIPPNLADELRMLAGRFRGSSDRQLRRDGQRVIGDTHMSIREHQDVTDSRVAAVQEDMTGMQLEQDATVADVAEVAAALARLLNVRIGPRLAKLERRADDLSIQVGSIETTVAQLLRAGTGADAALVEEP